MIYSVLVIEDEPNIRLFVTTNLQVRGYTVYEAATGADGLDLLRSVRPHLVILDMFLPDMTGRDILHSMMQDENLSTIPVMLMTASIPNKDDSNFPNVVQRVVKPASLSTVLTAVKAALTPR